MSKTLASMEALVAGADVTTTKLRRLCLTTAVLIAVSLFYLGAQPFAVGLFPEPWDKLAHFLVFAAIAVLLWVGTGGRRPLSIFCLVATIGALDEWHQGGLPGRSMDCADWLTDMAAAALAIAVMHAVINREARRSGSTR